MQRIIRKGLNESIQTKKMLLDDIDLENNIEALAKEIVHCLTQGGKLLICGNGGSASDALHFAGELVGRFQKERNSWPAVVLNADVATMTAIANDYGYSEVFARQVQGFYRPGDIFIGISTSGNSENVLEAVKKVQEMNGKTAALIGNDGGKIGELVDYPLIVKSNVTARIQESHITLIHILCELIEVSMSK